MCAGRDINVHILFKLTSFRFIYKQSLGFLEDIVTQFLKDRNRIQSFKRQMFAKTLQSYNICIKTECLQSLTVILTKEHGLLIAKM